MSAVDDISPKPLGLPGRRIPLVVKLVYTAFCAVMIPVYLWHYGPTNFVYFCDESVLLTLLAVWSEDPLPASMSAVGLLIPQAAWVVDFIATAVGHPILGLTVYMFDSTKPLFLRSLSSFHGWLPFLLVYLVLKLGYDRRALAAWTGLAIASMVFSYVFLPMPHPNPGMTPVNVDYVFGLSDLAPQSFVPGWLWFGSLLFGLPLLVYWPTHLVLRRLVKRGEPHGLSGSHATGASL